MSKFEDIDGGRLIYTCNCGWVDLGHANPKKAGRPHIGAITLWEEIQAEKGLCSEYDDGFLLVYSQDMRKLGLSSTESGRYFIKSRLDTGTKKAIALAIFQEISMKFETMQGKFPYSIFSSDSSFSQEDLVSNLIGFYRAIDPAMDFTALCGPLSKDASKEVWKSSGAVGSMKNRDFKPVFKNCKECQGKNVFPQALQAIKPAKKATSSNPPTKGVLFRNWSFPDDEKSSFDAMIREQSRLNAGRF